MWRGGGSHSSLRPTYGFFVALDFTRIAEMERPVLLSFRCLAERKL